MPKFSQRKDQNGLRIIFQLKNESKCPFNCRFCNVNKLPLLKPINNIGTFIRQYKKYSKSIHEIYHPLIYNFGNATNPKELSKNTLDFILNTFDNDKLVKFVSINSRESFATPELLNYLVNKKLKFPIHFILGVETFSKNIIKILGKNTAGELEKFTKKLKLYNEKYAKKFNKQYIFGLDVSLLFLPELYLRKNETRKNFQKIKEGIKSDLKQLLSVSEPSVPMEINIHPFCQVESLSYRDAPMNILIKMLPELQRIINGSGIKTHLFVGVEGSGYKKLLFQKWKKVINGFNQTGDCI